MVIDVNRYKSMVKLVKYAINMGITFGEMQELFKRKFSVGVSISELKEMWEYKGE